MKERQKTIEQIHHWAEKQCATELEILLANNIDLSHFLCQPSPNASAVIFGGFVRDVIHNIVHTNQVEYRDLDIVIKGEIEPGEIRTNFGGWRRSLSSGKQIDYWPLASTYAFRVGLFPASINNLLKSTVYTINACYFDINSSNLYEHKAIESILTRKICFNCRGYLDVFPEYQVYRALNYANRLGYELSPEVRAFASQTLRKLHPKTFLAETRRHRPDVDMNHITKLVRPLLPEIGWLEIQK